MVLLVPLHIVVTKHPTGSNLKKDEVLLACSSKDTVSYCGEGMEAEVWGD